MHSKARQSRNTSLYILLGSMLHSKRLGLARTFIFPVLSYSVIKADFIVLRCDVYPWRTFVDSEEATAGCSGTIHLA